MLLKLEDDIVINPDQIVSITRSNMRDRQTCITMSDRQTYFKEGEPEEIADKIAKLVAAADTYYFTTF